MTPPTDGWRAAARLVALAECVDQVVRGGAQRADRLRIRRSRRLSVRARVGAGLGIGERLSVGLSERLDGVGLALGVDLVEAGVEGERGALEGVAQGRGESRVVAGTVLEHELDERDELGGVAGIGQLVGRLGRGAGCGAGVGRVAASALIDASAGDASLGAALWSSSFGIGSHGGPPGRPRLG